MEDMVPFLHLIFGFNRLQVSVKLLESFAKDILMVFYPRICLPEGNQALTLVLRSESPRLLPLIFRTEIYESLGRLGILTLRMA